MAPSNRGNRTPVCCFLWQNFEEQRHSPEHMCPLDPEHRLRLSREALDGIAPPPADAPAVCILVTGVDRQHPLLDVALAAEDAQAVNPTWGSDDHDQDKHGTGMAGIALFRTPDGIAHVRRPRDSHASARIREDSAARRRERSPALRQHYTGSRRASRDHRPRAKTSGLSGGHRRQP